MARPKNVVFDAAGFGKTVQKIKPMQWRCPKKNCSGHERHPNGYFVFQNKDQCNVCGTSKPSPKNITYFKDTPEGRAQAAKGGGDGGGRGGGGSAESKEAKEIRETKERITRKQQQAELDKLKAVEKNLDAGAGGSVGGSGRPEPPGQGTDVDGGGISLEKLERIRDRREDELKYWQGRLRDLKKEDETDSTVQEGHDRAKDLFEKARKAVWDEQDPHEQMSKKSTKSDRLNRKVTTLERELQEQMVEKQAAEAKADECQDRVNEIIVEIDSCKAERDKLLEESHTLSEKMVGSSPEGIGELVDRQCAGTLSMFDDPLIAELEDVRAKRPDVVALTNQIAEALRALAVVTAQVKGGLDEAKIKAAVEAEKAATAARETEKVAANAKKAADIISKPNSFSSSSTAGPTEQAKLEAALAKPILERTGEELYITGRAGKRSKTETVAMDQEVANVC